MQVRRSQATCLLGEIPHPILQPLQGQRVHLVLDQIPHQVRRRRVVPRLLRVRVDPDDLLEFLHEALHPHISGFFVPVLDAATRLGDLVGRHGRVADEHYFVVIAVLVQQVEGGIPVPLSLRAVRATLFGVDDDLCTWQ